MLVLKGFHQPGNRNYIGIGLAVAYVFCFSRLLAC